MANNKSTHIRFFSRLEKQTAKAANLGCLVCCLNSNEDLWNFILGSRRDKCNPFARAYVE